jgi:hypothetical protein
MQRLYRRGGTASRGLVVSGQARWLGTANALHSDAYWTIQRELSSFPSTGGALSSSPYFQGKLQQEGPQWFTAFSDILQFNEAAKQLIPVGRPSNAFEDALRRALFSASPAEMFYYDKEGLSVPQLVARLSQFLPSDQVDPELYGFESLGAALATVNDLHFIIPEEGKVIPVHWARVVRQLLKQIPEQGLPLTSFNRLLCSIVPEFRKGTLPGLTLPAWIENRFSEWLMVYPSKVDPSQWIVRRQSQSPDRPSPSPGSQPLLGPEPSFADQVAAAIGYLESQRSARNVTLGPAERTDLNFAVSGGFSFTQEVLPLLVKHQPKDFGGSSWGGLLEQHRSVFDLAWVERADSKVDEQRGDSPSRSAAQSAHAILFLDRSGTLVEDSAVAKAKELLASKSIHVNKFQKMFVAGTTDSPSTPILAAGCEERVFLKVSAWMEAHHMIGAQISTTLSDETELKRHFIVVVPKEKESLYREELAGHLQGTASTPPQVLLLSL